MLSPLPNWYTSQSVLAERKWHDYFVSVSEMHSTGDDRQIKQFAIDQKGTDVGDLALLETGDLKYRLAAVNLVKEPKKSAADLNIAVEHYVQLLASNSSSFPLAKQRGTYALGYAFEAQGEFEKAKEKYQQIVDEAPDSAIAKLAQRELDRVNDSEITGIFAAYDAWKANAAATAPDSIKPPTLPGFDFDLADPIGENGTNPPAVDLDPTIGVESDAAKDDKADVDPFTDGEASATTADEGAEKTANDSENAATTEKTESDDQVKDDSVDQ